MIVIVVDAAISFSIKRHNTSVVVPLLASLSAKRGLHLVDIFRPFVLYFQPPETAENIDKSCKKCIMVIGFCTLQIINFTSISKGSLMFVMNLVILLLLILVGALVIGNLAKNLQVRNAAPAVMYQRIMTLDLTRVMSKVARRHPDWDIERLHNAKRMYLEYLYLFGTTKRGALAPWSQDLDDVWHVHLEDKEAYGAMCQEFFGAYFEHNTTTYGRGTDARKAALSYTKLCRDRAFGAPNGAPKELVDAYTKQQRIPFAVWWATNSALFAAALGGLVYSANGHAFVKSGSSDAGGGAYVGSSASSSDGGDGGGDGGCGGCGGA